MKRSRILSLLSPLCVLAIGSVPVVATDGARQKAAEPFAFRQGQTVYVTAFHTIEHFTSVTPRGLGVVPPTNIVDSHLPAELKVRQDFEKRKVYKLVSKATGSDFVFLMLLHDNAAEALALPPEVFKGFQLPFNIEALREAAYARVTVGPFKIHNLGKISDQLVKAFHEGEGRPAK